MNTPTGPAADASRRRARAVAAGVLGAEALVMGGFGLFYLVQLATGAATDTARVLTEAMLILAFAAAAAVLARLWTGRSSWPSTPTMVWHALLVPVAWAMFQSGQVLIGLLLVAAIVLAIGATLTAGMDDEETAGSS